MKDSYVEWIGEIPADWVLSTIGAHYKQRNEKVSDLDFAPLSVTKNGVVPQLDSAAKSSNHNDRKLVRKNDFVINSRSDRKMSCGIADEDGSVSLINIVLYSGSISKEYTKYLLKNYSFAEEFYRWGTGIVADLWSTNWDRMKKIAIPVPTLEEQNKIASILDELTEKIDSIILDTKQSIEELKKYKQSLITEAVTKGLNRNVGIKDSEIEWIGEMPKEWNLVKVNRLFAIKKNIANQNGYDVLSVTQSGLKVKDITRNEGQMAADYSKYQIVKPKDFVMNHMDLLTGWIDIAAQEGVTSPDYRVFYTKDIELVSIEFYLYVFQICYTNRIFYGLGQGVSNLGRWRLQTDKFLNFYLPLPPINEQQEIVKFLNGKLVEINSMIEQKKDLLGELEQYKKSLIYECVTGKKEM